VSAFVDASVYASMHALRLSVLPVLLLHRVGHFDAWKGAAWKRLCQLKADGQIQRLGASVQTLEELQRALQEPDISFIQLPLNLLDWRWDFAAPMVQHAKASRQITIHARSAFLQGLLLSSSAEHWKQANCEQPDIVQAWLSRQVATTNRSNLADLALAWVRSQEWVDGVVVGMERLEQLDDNLRHFTAPLLSDTEKQIIAESRPRLDEQTLNPALWKAAS
jgi:aryl-alcohol dehydrogenase-like predicted oxidoreductase